MTMPVELKRGEAHVLGAVLGGIFAGIAVFVAVYLDSVCGHAPDPGKQTEYRWKLYEVRRACCMILLFDIVASFQDSLHALPADTRNLHQLPTGPTACE